MIVYPAMDLMDGAVVRLRQGQFDDVTVYPTNPLDALRGFAEAGAEWAHIVDLDGARASKPVQHDLIARLARESNLSLQVAGGFRDREQLARMFDVRVARVVVGSIAVRQPDRVRAWIAEFGPQHIALSLDVKVKENEPIVAIAGWTEDSGRSLWDVASEFPEARHMLVTDIGRDGMLQGPNFALYEEIALRLPDIEVQASGGISSLVDLQRLTTAGAIIGKALWEGRISLGEACRLARA